jgi:hypothetical protein
VGAWHLGDLERATRLFTALSAVTPLRIRSLAESAEVEPAVALAEVIEGL